MNVVTVGENFDFLEIFIGIKTEYRRLRCVFEQIIMDGTVPVEDAVDIEPSHVSRCVIVVAGKVYSSIVNDKVSHEIASVKVYLL